MAHMPPGANATPPPPGGAPPPYTSSSGSYSAPPAAPYANVQAPYQPYGGPPPDPAFAAAGYAPPNMQYPPAAYGAPPSGPYGAYPPQPYTTAPYGYAPPPQSGNMPAGMYAQQGAPMGMQPPPPGYHYPPPQGFPGPYDPSTGAQQYGAPSPGYGGYQAPQQGTPVGAGGYPQQGGPVPMASPASGGSAGVMQDIEAAANAAFSHADTARKEHIDVRGFIVAVRAFGVPLEYKEMLKYFETADRDESGHITRVEFVNLCKFQLASRRQHAPLPPGMAPPPNAHVQHPMAHPAQQHK